MEALLAKVERASLKMFGRFSYSPMPRTGVSEEPEKPPQKKVPFRKLAALGAFGAVVLFGVVCVVGTISAATTMHGGERRRPILHDGHALRAKPRTLQNRTAEEVKSVRNEPRKCCTEHSAECLSCQGKISLAKFCLRQKNGNVMGCEGFCGLNEDSFNYPGGDLLSLESPTSQACCAACREHTKCTSWTWAKEPSREDYRICYLKNQLQLRREPDMGYISGLPGHDSLTFQIRTSSDECLDVRSIQHKQGVSTCAKAAAPYQKWSYDRITGQIRNTRLGDRMCLDARQADQAGSNIFLHTCSISFLSQRWVFDSVTGQIENSFGFCMDILPAASVHVSPTVRLQPCTPHTEAQRWLFSSGSDKHLPVPMLKTSSTASSTTRSSTTRTTTTPTSTSSQGATSTSTVAPATTVTQTTTSTRLTGLGGMNVVADASLFCFSLMLPWGYEPDLLRMQITERRSIFACEDFVVYSSVALDLGSGYTTSRINTDLHCPMGGQYHTALNTPIFKKIWTQVLKDGRFRLHEWTVKADPDCVFLPSRLRDIVRVESLRANVESGKGMFLNNCRFGLHGPLEVVSRRALEAYGREAHRCKQPPQEDVYLQHCLLSLGVVQMNQFNLLAEAACRSPDWQSCHGPQAAFHPFKSLNAYRSCQAAAETNGTWSRAQVKAVKATAETIGVDPETAKLGIQLLSTDSDGESKQVV